MVPLLILALAFPPAVSRVPYLPPSEPLPDVSARSWLVFDDGYEYEIASHREDRRAAMASTTKLMTALLVVENMSPTDIVTISRRAEATGQKQIRLRSGDRWMVAELLEALMVVSANDVAIALAEHVAGNVDSFVGLMNDRAVELGMADTAYVNPHGLDAAGHYTTANDLLIVARQAMEWPILAGFAGQQEATLTAGDGSTSTWESTNEFLSDYRGAIGLKTGWTSRAREVLVAAAERDERRVYAVVMGSTDAAADASALLEYGFRAFGPAERRLVPLMEDRHNVALLRQSLPADAISRLAHLRGLLKRETAPWE